MVEVVADVFDVFEVFEVDDVIDELGTVDLAVVADDERFGLGMLEVDWDEEAFTGILDVAGWGSLDGCCRAVFCFAGSS